MASFSIEAGDQTDEADSQNLVNKTGLAKMWGAKLFLFLQNFLETTIST